MAETEVKPRCLCRAETVRLAESKKVIIYHCQSCDRVLVQHKNFGWLHWYRPEQ